MPLELLTHSDAHEADATALLQRHPTHIIYKHSPFCSLSFVAEEQVRRYAAEPDSIPVTLVDVIRQRAMSDAIEEATGVRHESPQVLVVRDGRVSWQASHRRITLAELQLATRPE